MSEHATSSPEITFAHAPAEGTGRIWKVFWLLSVVTVIELVLGFGLAKEWYGNPETSHSAILFVKGVICILSLAKAFYIVSVFMHLGDEIRNFIMTIVVPLCLFIWFIAAFLWAQMEEADAITTRRLAMWQNYHQWFAEAERHGRLRRPVTPAHCTHNAHMYYVLLPSLERRTAVIEQLLRDGVQSVFHYVPLHSSPAGRKYGRAAGELAVTDDLSARLLRLPMWVGMEDRQTSIIQSVLAAL